MPNTWCEQAAQSLLHLSLTEKPLDLDLIQYLAEHECSLPAFRILAEGLADRFEPELCNRYVTIFSRLISARIPEYSPEALEARYARVRASHLKLSEPDRIVVLSRVTLGADIAIASMILEAAKIRFPHAEILLAGSEKSAELFAQDQRIRHLPLTYPRGGTLSECLRAAQTLIPKIGDRTLLVDPDSRISQLGLFPIFDESRYLFFESRAFGGSGNASLGDLTSSWLSNVFGVENARARIAPSPVELRSTRPSVAVSFGVGGNSEKQMPEEFERDLIRFLCSKFDQVVVDRGFGKDETSRIDRVIEGTRAQPWTGSFAQFASLIAQSDLYLGYDSAGQHAAAALGIPLVTLFKGFSSERMFARWQPSGLGPKKVLKVDEATPVEFVISELETFSSQTA